MVTIILSILFLLLALQAVARACAE